MSKMKSVLFVCTANRYRSPFAAAIFRQRLDKDGLVEEWKIGSAGTWAPLGFPALPHIVQKAQELGLDLSGHSSIEVTKGMLSDYKTIIVMETGHKEALITEFPDARERIFLLSEIVDRVVYDIADPAKNMEEADEIAGELYDLVQRGYSDICNVVD
ncbi:MAG: low molecular weight protein arginine phosphatase [Bacteroidetes bacterium]|nr:low molecular weight protein arginine phosphatase [Bacteroidota bacterium]